MSTSTAKLYYTPTSCGAASFIAAYIADLKIDFEQVNIHTHVTASGVDYYKINPKGNVPALVIGDVLLNEGAAILQWIADQNPSSKLAPVAGTIERSQLQNHLNYIASEVHQTYGPLFYGIKGDARDEQIKKLYTKYDYLEKYVLTKKDQSFILGDHFTIADAYLYIVISWAPYLELTLDKHPKLAAYYEGIKAIPNVQAAHQRMAQLPAAK